MATTGNVIGQRAVAVVPVKKRRTMPRWLRALLHNPLSIIGAVIVLAFVVVALLAPVIAAPRAGVDPYLIPRAGFQAQPQPPGPGHLFGTTQGQYDIWYGVVWGTRTALKVGLVISFLTVLTGGIVGSVSGYIGGIFDEIVQRIVEIVLAFPFLLAALTLATVLAPRLQGQTILTFSGGLLSGMVALIAFSWPGYSRLIRGEVLSVKQRDFVLAAKVVGVPDWQILLRHILPNSIYSLLVVASLDIGTYVLSFAALSFLGLGAPLGYADWGQLLSFARNWIPSLSQFWYIVVFPGAALVLYVLGWNLIGDAFRDALDPKMQGSR